MPISCHFRDCKALLVMSLTYVSGAISSVQTYTVREICLIMLKRFTLCTGVTDRRTDRQN